MTTRLAPGAACFPNGRLLVFAKAPVPGRVKTRLMPYLDPRGCASLQRWLIERTLTTAFSEALCPVELWCAPARAHSFLLECARRFDLALRVQHGADLGMRMHFALRGALARADFAIIIGSDCPALSPAYLARACALLADAVPIVLGPAEDGGYVLIGARNVSAELFTNIAWGTPAVLEQTRARLRSLNLDWRELEPLWDVDRPADLARLRAQHPESVHA